MDSNHPRPFSIQQSFYLCTELHRTIPDLTVPYLTQPKPQNTARELNPLKPFSVQQSFYLCASFRRNPPCHTIPRRTTKHCGGIEPSKPFSVQQSFTLCHAEQHKTVPYHTLQHRNLFFNIFHFKSSELGTIITNTFATTSFSQNIFNSLRLNSVFIIRQ